MFLLAQLVMGSSIVWQEIVVIGGGNTAVEEALFLTNFASKVTLIHRRDEFRCEKILEDRMMKNKKIEPLYFHELVEVTGTDMPLGVEGIKVKHTKTGERYISHFDKLFIIRKNSSPKKCHYRTTMQGCLRCHWSRPSKRIGQRPTRNAHGWVCSYKA